MLVPFFVFSAPRDTRLRCLLAACALPVGFVAFTLGVDRNEASKALFSALLGGHQLLLLRVPRPPIRQLCRHCRSPSGAPEGLAIIRASLRTNGTTSSWWWPDEMVLICATAAQVAIDLWVPIPLASGFPTFG